MARVSRRVAIAAANHPPHRNFQRIAGIVMVAFPEHPRGWAGVKVRRACHKAGGHWWHPADAMILWRCCACGALKDGWPRDGSRSDQGLA